MCKLKSAIIMKDRIFMPDHDSHSKMLDELGITDDYFNASKVFVRAELVPADEDVFSDIDGWEFSVDQDITPEWFDEKDCAERMRKAVKEWAKTHIFVGQNDLEISHGENICIKDCKNVDICGNATVEYIYGSATVKNIYDSATVKYICDNATVKYIHGSATVISSPYTKWNNSTSMVIDDNATFKDCYSRTIYQAGGWELVKVTRGK